MNVQFVFVGERRSEKAQRMGVTWADGRLCAKNLHEALRAAGIDPSGQTFVNAYHDDGRLHEVNLTFVERFRVRGFVIVALGEKAGKALVERGIAHLRLIHPAARGSIRKTERYRAHVASVLAGK